MTNTRFLQWPTVQAEGVDAVLEPDTLNFKGAGVSVDETPSRTAEITITGASNVKFQFAPNMWFSSLAAVNGVSTSTNLTVGLFPVSLLAQTINRVAFNVGNSSFGANDQMCVGLYSMAGAKLIDGLWKNVDVAGNKITTLSTAVEIGTGQYYLAWAFNKVSAGGIFCVSLNESIADIPFMNHTSPWFGRATNNATAGADESAGLPATLGTILAKATLNPINLVPIVIFETTS